MTEISILFSMSLKYLDLSKRQDVAGTNVSQLTGNNDTLLTQINYLDSLMDGVNKSLSSGASLDKFTNVTYVREFIQHIKNLSVKIGSIKWDCKVNVSTNLLGLGHGSDKYLARYYRCDDGWLFR